MRACLWAPGAVPDQGGFEPLCVSSLPAPKLGICELGWYFGETLNPNRSGMFFDLGMPSTSCIFDVFTLGSSACSETKFPIFLAFPWAATAGKIGLKQQSLGSPKNPFFQSKKLRFSARSEASSLFFQLFHGQLRLEKSVFSGKAWAAKKILVSQTRKLKFSARSEASSLFFQLFHGQLRLEKSVLSGKAWAAQKILDFQTRTLRVSTCSETSSLFL